MDMQDHEGHPKTTMDTARHAKDIDFTTSDVENTGECGVKQ